MSVITILFNSKNVFRVCPSLASCRCTRCLITADQSQLHPVKKSNQLVWTWYTRAWSTWIHALNFFPVLDRPWRVCLGEAVVRLLAQVSQNFFFFSFCQNRAEEMNNSHLAELEEDIQHQLARTEERVRDEVSGEMSAEFMVNCFSCFPLMFIRN